jgi:hypothetical protein
MTNRTSETYYTVEELRPIQATSQAEMKKNFNTRWNLFRQKWRRVAPFWNCSNTSDTQHGRRNGTEHRMFEISPERRRRVCEETSTEQQHSVLECRNGSASGKGGDIKWGDGKEQDAVEETGEKRGNSFYLGKYNCLGSPLFTYLLYN